MARLLVLTGVQDQACSNLYYDMDPWPVGDLVDNLYHSCVNALPLHEKKKKKTRKFNVFQIYCFVLETDDRWLCCDRFTVADISLTILLDRLYLLGLETRLWTDGKKPGITRYYERVRQRESYKKTVPSQLTHLKTFLEMQSGFLIGTVLSTVFALVVGGVLFLKKK